MVDSEEEEFEFRRRAEVERSTPPPARARPSMAGDFVRPIRAAWDKTVADFKDDRENDAQTLKSGKRSGTILDDHRRTLRGVGNIFSLATSPVTGALDATVARPAARALNSLPMRPYASDGFGKAPRPLYGQEAEDVLAGDISTAFMGARAGPVRAAPAAIPKPAPRVRPVDLGPARDAAYKTVENTGAKYSTRALDDLIRGMTDEMTAANISPTRHPKASSMLAEVQAMRGRQPTITQLDQLRQVIRRDVANASDQAEAFFGKKMIKNLDEFIDAAGQGEVVAGDAKAASTAVRTARDLNTRVRKVEAVEGALGKAERQAGKTGSGGNVDNATRQKVDRLIDEIGNWTPDERAALQEIVMGGKGQNFLRQVGKLSPQGNGLMTALNIGGTMANPILGIPGMAGIVAKMGADAMTARKVERLIDLIANGSAAPKIARAPLRAPNVRPAAATFAPANIFDRQEYQTSGSRAR